MVWVKDCRFKKYWEFIKKGVCGNRVGFWVWCFVDDDKMNLGSFRFNVLFRVFKWLKFSGIIFCYC